MTTMDHLARLLERYPSLNGCRSDLIRAFELLEIAFSNKRKLLVCGNGGSASDAEHIVGELMKSFAHPRSLPAAEQERLTVLSPMRGEVLAKNLQGALPALALGGNIALSTAYSNDVMPELMFAQQVYGYGQEGDVLWAISTSGQSRNILYAVDTAKLRGMAVLGLTGEDGGELKALCDVCIRVPSGLTPDIQELHLPIYHTLCLMLEERFF